MKLQLVVIKFFLLRKEILFHLLSFIAILVLSFLVMYPSFNLAFEDEEWQGIVLPQMAISSSRIFSSPYGIPMWFMTSLYSLLGPNFVPYFILSFIVRDLVAFSVLVFIYILTKNRIASFLGGVMVAVTFSGLQTTFEIMNMISYISLFWLLIFLCSFFFNQKTVSLKYLALMGISLFLSTIITSPRVFPIYAWVLITDSFSVLVRFKKSLIKPFLVRQSVIFLIFLLLYKMGILNWYSKDISSGSNVGDIGKFFSDIIAVLTNLNSQIILNFLRGLGNIIFPDFLDRSGTISLLLGGIFLIALCSLFVYVVKRRTKLGILIFSFMLWPLLFYTIFFLIYLNGVPKNTAIFPSQLRYMLPPFIGFIIALAIFPSWILKKNIKLRRIILSIVIVYIFIHAFATYTYLSKLSKTRDGSYMVKIWEQIKQLIPQSSLSTEKTNVFYFETDGSSRAIYTVNDGFIGHAIAKYKIDGKPAKLNPAEISAFGKLIAPPIITYEELVSYINKSLYNDSQPDIWDRIFILRVDGERVINIKNDVRKRVEESLNNR